MPAFINIVGQKFSRWTVLEREGPRSGVRRWRCVCDCGFEGRVSSYELRAGTSRSCGCLGHEETRKRSIRHGMTGHPVFAIWRGMWTRCTNTKRAGYKNYGARGIFVCARWKSFEAFWEDMGPSWVAGLMLEREDNDGPYSPDNCVWATRAEQNRNRRYCVFIDSPWGRVTITEAAKEMGVTWQTMRKRVAFWPPSDWFKPPTNKGRSKACRASPSREVSIAPPA